MITEDCYAAFMSRKPTEFRLNSRRFGRKRKTWKETMGGFDAIIIKAYIKLICHFEIIASEEITYSTQFLKSVVTIEMPIFARSTGFYMLLHTKYLYTTFSH